ncbi:hypothetical protein [Bartonella massiliensis]|uniref:hypothetical protein n=1 Tax=Bartonella massiliensis TaxID=929795 RepID=UPI00163C7303|nr:hypothetical protein [Bartonella massiliensis]
MTGKVKTLQTKINKNGSAPIKNTANASFCETVVYFVRRDNNNVAHAKRAITMKVIQAIILYSFLERNKDSLKERALNCVARTVLFPLLSG